MSIQLTGYRIERDKHTNYLGEKRIQFYIYHEDSSDWLDVYSADDNEDGFVYCIKAIEYLNRKKEERND